MGYSINTQRESRRPLRDRLMDKVEYPESGCWEWSGSTTQHGYGRMSWRGRVYRTHRLSAYLWKGLDLDDEEVKVCHTCDNPPCINPEHLYLGDQRENVRDMVLRGRNYPGPERSTHCKRGHELAIVGTVGIKKPRCKVCVNEGQRSRRERKRTVRAITEALGEAS